MDEQVQDVPEALRRPADKSPAALMLYGGFTAWLSFPECSSRKVTPWREGGSLQRSLCRHQLGPLVGVGV